MKMRESLWFRLEKTQHRKTIISIVQYVFFLTASPDYMSMCAGVYAVV